MEYFNNKIICDLVEEKHKGIIAVLVSPVLHFSVLTTACFFQDEECLRPGEVTDMTFLSKLTSVVGTHAHFVTYVWTEFDNSKWFYAYYFVCAIMLSCILTPLLLNFHFHGLSFCSHETSDYEARKTIERDQFRLCHYAGDVTYNVDGERNKELTVYTWCVHLFYRICGQEQWPVVS